jgi:transcriptional regulator with XRE-family HTH domain
MDEVTVEARTVGQAVGERLRSLRQERDDLRRQEDVAARVRESVGLKWTRSTVAGLETGRRVMSIEELLSLSIALRVQPWEWFVGDGAVTLSEGTTVTYRAMRYLLGSGETTRRDDFDIPELRAERESVKKRTREALTIGAQTVLTAVWPTAAPLARPIEAAEDARRPAEEKAAAKFGMKPIVFSVLFHAWWGRGLTTERDARVMDRRRHPAHSMATPRAVQALRGHVTRELLEEFGDLLDQHAEHLELDADVREAVG